MQITTIVRFDWSAVLENFWYQKLAPFFSVHLSFWHKFLKRVFTPVTVQHSNKKTHETMPECQIRDW